MEKVCTKCNQSKPESEFPIRKERKSKTQSACKTCQAALTREWYKNHSEHHKANVRKINDKKDAIAKNIIVNAKSVPCADCHIQYPPCCMDFDHLDPTIKVGNISCMGTRTKICVLEEEIKKCEVVCSNCHRLRTQNRMEEK